MAGAQEVGAEFVAAFNAHDDGRMRELSAADAVFEGPGVQIEGRDATVGYAMAWINAFDDAKLEVHNELVAGDWVIHEFVFAGTHTGTLQSPAGDIPATNRQLRGRGAQILHIEEGVVVDTRLYFDQVDVMTQLGLMPETVSATA
jgi:predicted ester cyclase